MSVTDEFKICLVKLNSDPTVIDEAIEMAKRMSDKQMTIFARNNYGLYENYCILEDMRRAYTDSEWDSFLKIRSEIKEECRKIMKSQP